MPPPDQAIWFTETVRPHEPALRAFLSRRFSSLPDHDDLVQETYARLLRIADPERLVHARAFLFTTARNVAIDHVRRTPWCLNIQTMLTRRRGSSS
jgi:RNA polymerase sigma-70 factor (ECF subfamily)